MKHLLEKMLSGEAVRTEQGRMKAGMPDSKAPRLGTCQGGDGGSSPLAVDVRLSQLVCLVGPLVVE
jgi:hypothetical protein